MFVLAGIAFAVLMSLSAYFLPASNREFKDLQFEIRNRFVSALLQEGTFTTISDKLTIYIGGRDERGEVIGLLIKDDREPQQPVTIVAERGIFVRRRRRASRIIMVNGTRQRFDRTTGKLPVLTFERYTLDLQHARDAGRAFSRAAERYLDELFWPRPELDPVTRRSSRSSGHQRLSLPLSVLQLRDDPARLPLPGEFNRRGQRARVLIAVGLAFLFQAVDLGVKNVATRSRRCPLMYRGRPAAVGARFRASLLSRRQRFRRPAPAAA